VRAPHPHGQVLPKLWIILTGRANNNVAYVDMGRLSDNIMDGICHVISYLQFRYADTVIPVFFSVNVDLVHVIPSGGFEHNIVDAPPPPVISTLPTFTPSELCAPSKIIPCFDWSKK
jgi:hypothetical protein